VLEGNVSAGREWKTSLGQGWVFRIAPIRPEADGYSGWDLMVDRDPASGFPDALLLGTLPYNSINEREIGTTFGLRAQDAIGWNPRSFHFLTDPAAFREGQQIFRRLLHSGAFQPGKQNALQAGSAPGSPTSSTDSGELARILQLQQRASSGEFRILDARLAPGIGDAAPYAENWALAATRIPHELEAASSGKSTAQGTLNWMKFRITLWLPRPWRLPGELHGTSSACPK
jgi:hypothetical protein